jgi:Domain of unknown function (DUF4136)
MRNLPTGVACAAASFCFLGGCAGVRTDVLTSQGQNDLQLKFSYEIARSPVQVASSAQARYETLVRSELGRYGLVDAEAGRARYVLSIAYNTRAASVAVDADDCKGSSCRNPGGARFLWFGHAWRHSMTLRFFDPASGDEVYKVSATSLDGDADPQHAIPYLVKGALARLPFSQHRRWRVNQTTGHGKTPQMLSVEPVGP